MRLRFMAPASIQFAGISPPRYDARAGIGPAFSDMRANQQRMLTA